MKDRNYNHENDEQSNNVKFEKSRFKVITTNKKIQ